MVHRGKNHGNKHDPTAKHHGGPAHSNHLPHSHIHKHRNGDYYSMLASSVQYKRARWNHIQYGPESMPTTSFDTSDSFFDIKLSGAGVDTLCHFALQISVQNTAPTPANAGEGNAIPVLPPYFFNRIEIQPDGGETEDTLYPEDILDDWYELYKTDKKANLGRAIGMSTQAPAKWQKNTYSNLGTFDEDGMPIIPGEIREFTLPIHSMLTQAKLYLPTKKQDPRWRFYIANNVLCSDSDFTNGANLVINQVQGIITGVLYEDDIRINLSKHYMNMKTISRVTVRERQTESIASVAPNVVSTDKTLTVFNGHFAMFYVRLEKGNSNSRPEGRYDSLRTLTDGSATDDPQTYTGNYLPIIRMTLTDNDGNPVFYNNTNANFLRWVMPTVCCDGAPFYYEKNIFPWTFCMDLPDVICCGKNSGGIYLNTEYSLRVVPGNFDVTGETDYVLRVNARRYALLTCQGGKYTVKKL